MCYNEDESGGPFSFSHKKTAISVSCRFTTVVIRQNTFSTGSQTSRSQKKKIMGRIPYLETPQNALQLTSRYERAGTCCDKEEWRSLTWDGVIYSEYAVSSCGRARSNREGFLVMLSPCDVGNGYLAVMVTPVGHPVRLARAIAETFVAGKDCTHCFVNHKDGNKANNHVGNLEWVTSRENRLHAQATGLHKKNTGWAPRYGESNCAAKLTKDAVAYIKSVPKTRGSGLELAKQFGVAPTTISDIRNNKIWQQVEAAEVTYG